MVSRPNRSATQGKRRFSTACGFCLGGSQSLFRWSQSGLPAVQTLHTAKRDSGRLRLLFRAAPPLSRPARFLVLSPWPLFVSAVPAISALAAVARWGSAQITVCICLSLCLTRLPLRRMMSGLSPPTSPGEHKYPSWCYRSKLCLLDLPAHTLVSS